MFGTGAPYGRAPEFATIELREQFIAGDHGPAAGAPRAARRADPHRDARRVPVLAGRQHPAGPASACGRSSPCPGRSPARRRRAAWTCSRRPRSPGGRIALQKLAGHVTALVVGDAARRGPHLGSSGWRSHRCPATRSRSTAALGQVTLYGLLMLAAGSVAFAAAPSLGRTRALASRAHRAVRRLPDQLVCVAVVVPRRALEPLSWFTWTAGHRPMAGVTDWVSLVLLVVVTVAVPRDRRRRRSPAATSASPLPLAWLRLPAAGRHRRTVHAGSSPTGRRSRSRGASGWASTAR